MDLLDNLDLNWVHFTGNERFDYSIDYWGALLNAREDGHVDLLYRWAPNSYCHFHRHVAETTSTVLAGELHVLDFVDGQEGETRVRKAGDYAHKEPGDVHMEHGGPGGALVMFNLYTPDGRLAELLGSDGQTISTTTLEEMLTGRMARRSA